MAKKSQHGLRLASELTPRNCKACNTLFKPRYNSYGVYCSQDCAGIGRAKRQTTCGHLDREHRARGMCDSCYVMWLRTKNPSARETHRRSQRKYWNTAKANRFKDRWSFVRWLNQLKEMYGITHEEYFRMFNDQGGLCALCREKPERRLAVDHDHETGKVRALLCRGCNFFIGQIEKYEKLIPAALTYIADHGAKAKEAANG